MTRCLVRMERMIAISRLLSNHLGFLGIVDVLSAPTIPKCKMHTDRATPHTSEIQAVHSILDTEDINPLTNHAAFN